MSAASRSSWGGANVRRRKTRSPSSCSHTRQEAPHPVARASTSPPACAARHNRASHERRLSVAVCARAPRKGECVDAPAQSTSLREQRLCLFAWRSAARRAPESRNRLMPSQPSSNDRNSRAQAGRSSPQRGWIARIRVRQDAAPNRPRHRQRRSSQCPRGETPG